MIDVHKTPYLSWNGVSGSQFLSERFGDFAEEGLNTWHHVTGVLGYAGSHTKGARQLKDAQHAILRKVFFHPQP